MLGKIRYNTQKASNYIYYALSSKGYFENIVEELPEKLSIDSDDVFIFYKFANMYDNNVYQTIDVMIDLYIKDSLKSADKISYESKFNEVIEDAIERRFKRDGYEEYSMSIHRYPRGQAYEHGYSIISQPIRIIVRNSLIK